jgi:hypothetical protein
MQPTPTWYLAMSGTYHKVLDASIPDPVHRRSLMPTYLFAEYADILLQVIRYLQVGSVLRTFNPGKTHWKADLRTQGVAHLQGRLGAQGPVGPAPNSPPGQSRSRPPTSAP